MSDVINIENLDEVKQHLYEQGFYDMRRPRKELWELVDAELEENTKVQEFADDLYNVLINEQEDVIEYWIKQFKKDSNKGLRDMLDFIERKFYGKDKDECEF